MTEGIQCTQGTRHSTPSTDPIAGRNLLIRRAFCTTSLKANLACGHGWFFFWRKSHGPSCRCLSIGCIYDIYPHKHTGWRRCIGCLKLHVISCKRNTHYRALLQKETYKDKALYGYTPPCTRTHTILPTHIHTCKYTHNMHNRIVVSDTHPMGLHCNILQHILPHAVRNALQHIMQHIMQHILQLTLQHRIAIIDTNPGDNDGSIYITSMQTNTL